MLFSDLIDYLKNEKTFNIILNCSTDLHEIRDVELLDGTQTGYATDIVYFGYPDVLSPDMQPSQCILVRGENYLFPYSCTDRATVQAKELFAVFNAAKQFLQTHEQVSLYEELVRKGHSSHSLDEVINSASIKLGYFATRNSVSCHILHQFRLRINYGKRILNVDIVHTISLKM